MPDPQRVASSRTLLQAWHLQGKFQLVKTCCRAESSNEYVQVLANARIGLQAQTTAAVEEYGYRFEGPGHAHTYKHDTLCEYVRVQTHA